MSDVDLLPDDLQAKSLSGRDIVLLYDDVLAALDHFVATGVAPFAWEGLIRRPDDLFTHAVRRVELPDGSMVTGIISMAILERDEGERWPAYVARAVAACRLSIIAAQEAWDEQPGVLGARLHYSLGVWTHEEYDAAYGPTA
ncbi:MAG: hypothetical protein M3O34_13700 [Chloroflexota bacterium]|nr:hypothetical protein [Chloroflexota bacterium]